MKSCWNALAVLAATSAVLVVTPGCSHQPVSAASDTAPVAVVEPVPDRNIVAVPNPERFPLTEAAARRETDRVTANGVVAADVSRTYPVNALSSGRVVEVKARLGDDVQKGQLLLTMTSPDMSQGISDLQKFKATEALAKTQLDRAQLLNSHGVLAQKDLEVAQDTYNKAKIDRQAAEEHIRILGGDPEHPSLQVEIRAAVSGTIVEQNVTQAAGVKSLDNSPNLFTIADLSHVWVLCDVYENDLGRVRAGDLAEIELSAYPNRKLTGRVTNIAKLLDPNTRTAKVRIELANENGLLRPNMFASVHLVSQGAQTRTVVPETAVLRLQDRDWVFLKLNDKQFRRTEVQVGAVETDHTQPVLHGVKAGDQVVSDALTFDREVQKSTEQ